MDLEEDSARYGTLRIHSSSSSSTAAAFFSANQSPVPSDLFALSDHLGDDTKLKMDSLDSESLTGFKFEADCGAEACTSSDPRKLENASSSTVIYNTAVSGYGVHRSFSIRHKGKRGRKIGRLLEISAAPQPSFSNRLRSCDVFIGFHGRKPLLLRFANWLRAELEVQGLSCFLTDRARCRNSRKHSIVERAMDASTFGVVIITRKSFRNPYTIEELKFFSSKKNLVPIYFDVAPNDCLGRDIIEKRGEIWEKYGGELWLLYGGVEKEWREGVSALSCGDEWKLEAQDGRWRDCILRGVTLLALRLGRRGVVHRLTKWREKAEREEFPFPRNENFVGRRKELSELEFMLFGDVCGDAERDYFDLKARTRRKNLTVKPNSNRKGKEPMLWKESEKEIEMQNSELSPPRKSKNNTRPRKRSMKVVYGKGIACVTGDPGIGKTELLLEYAYRFHQRYKMVLWIGGESRYIRQNYLNLWSFLEIDVGVESSLEKGRTKSFEEQEEAATARVRKELMRNIPFLLIIDNLESEKDWWDHKMVMDLLPRFGGETHVIISTRLSTVMNLEPLRLSFLSEVEAMTLMQGGGLSLKDQSITEIDALRSIEEKLGRLTLALAIVGAILSELPINPSRLLDTINRMPWRDLPENHSLRRNTFLVQLFEVCFSIFDHADGPGSLATRMVLASGWFAPAPVPVQILAQAAHRIPEKQKRRRIWKMIVHSLSCNFASSYARRSEAEASSLLLRFNMARRCTKEGSLKLNELVKTYARKRGIAGAPEAMVQAVITRGSVSSPSDSDHIWAACFLLLGFGKDPIVVDLKVTELIFLAKQVIMPLAIRTFVAFSRCSAALEVLRLCTEALEAADEAFVTPVERWTEKSLCWKPIHTKAQLNPYLWQELALTRATVLEVRAKLMARGGQLDIADDLIRKAIFIRISICGDNHPETLSAQETLSKFTRLNATMQNHTSP